VIIDSKKFDQELRKLAKDFTNELGEERSYSDSVRKYKKQLYKLLIDAGKSENWSELAEIITFGS